MELDKPTDQDLLDAVVREAAANTRKQEVFQQIEIPMPEFAEPEETFREEVQRGVVTMDI